MDEARILHKMADVQFAPVRFNDLLFIRNILKWVDFVGYITLEFRGREIGKHAYSAPRRGRMPETDLKKSRRVREDVEDAFKRGGIRLMNGYITKSNGEIISFALNFGQGKNKDAGVQLRN